MGLKARFKVQIIFQKLTLVVATSIKKIQLAVDRLYSTALTTTQILVVQIMYIKDTRTQYLSLVSVGALILAGRF
jgi:hypothetical protein